MVRRHRKPANEMHKNKTNRHPRSKSQIYRDKVFLYDPSKDFNSTDEYQRVKSQLMCYLRIARFTKTTQITKISKSNSIETNSNDAYLHQLIYLHNVTKYFSTLLQTLGIRDPTIVCEALFTIHDIFAHQYVCEYTSKILEAIDTCLYKDILDLLRPTIHKYPYLFPLLCAMTLFAIDDSFLLSVPFDQMKGKSSIFKFRQNFNKDVDFAFHELVIPEYSDKWSIFPFLLSFFLPNQNDKITVLQIVARSIQGKWNQMHICILLMIYLQDFFDISTNNSLYIFFNELTVITTQKDILSNILVNVAFSFLFIPYFKEPCQSDYYNSFPINKITDIINFLEASNDKDLNGKFFVRVEHEQIFHENLYQLAVHLINSSLLGSHSYSPNYIANVSNIILSFQHNMPICRVDDFASRCKFIEKMTDDYKSQYLKQIPGVLRHIKDSLTSKIFTDYDEQTMKQSKNLLSNGVLSQKLNLKEPKINATKHKRTLDFCSRQAILIKVNKIASQKNINVPRNCNCSIVKNLNTLIPASIQLKNDVVTIIWTSHIFKVDVKDFHGFKRESRIFEFFSTEGKSFYTIFNDNESSKQLKKKLKKKKVYSKKKSEKILDQYKSLWEGHHITTFELLMFLNTYSGKTLNAKIFPFLPSVRSKNIITEKGNIVLKLPESIDFDIRKNFSNELVDDTKRVYNVFLHKSVVSAELYYLFESIAKTETIPPEIASDRFEFLYKNRKILENIVNIKDWVNNIFGVELPVRQLKNMQLTFPIHSIYPSYDSTKLRISYVAHFIDNEFDFNFLIITDDGSVYIAANQTLKHIPSINIKCGVISSLIDGVIAYDNNSHNLLIVDKYGETAVIPHIFINPLYAAFSGSISRLIYLSTPTRINLSRDLTFSDYNYENSKKKVNKVTNESIYPFTSGLSTIPSSSQIAFDVKCQKFGNKQIYQVPSRVTLLRTSISFNLVVLASQDCTVRICTLFDGKTINDFDLKGEEAIEILITGSFGFIFIVTKSKIYLLTNNGTLIKEMDYKGANYNIYTEVYKWYTFTSKEGIDFILTLSSDNVIRLSEAFYFDRFGETIMIGKFDNLLDITFHPSTDEFIFLHADGKLTRELIATRNYILNY